MILDHALVAAGDEDEMFDAGFPCLIDHILDQRLVDDGQHFLRHCLGGGQDAGAETGDRKNGFADFQWNGDIREKRETWFCSHVGSRFAAGGKAGGIASNVKTSCLLSYWKP